MMRASESLLACASVVALGAGLFASGCSGAESVPIQADTAAQHAGVSSGSDAGGSPASCGVDAAPQAEASAACAACTPATCSVVTPSNALIVDWRDVGPGGLFVDNDTFTSPNPNWWLGFYGSPYVFPSTGGCSASQPAFPLAQTTNGSWHVTGTVGDWSGFGLWLGACTVDMSAYRGISFQISGSVGASGTLKLSVGTGADWVPESCRTNVGTCATGTCTSPSKTIQVPATPGAPITVLWSDLTAGSPVASPDPSQIIQLMWSFDWVDWAGMKSTPYPVDVTVGAVSLVP